MRQSRRPLDMTDLFTRAKLRSIEKQKRRMKRERRENKLETFDLDMKTHNERMHKQVRQQRIKELIETIKALQFNYIESTMPPGTVAKETDIRTSAGGSALIKRGR